MAKAKNAVVLDTLENEETETDQDVSVANNDNAEDLGSGDTYRQDADQKVDMVSWEEIVCDLSFNVRNQDTYTPKALEQLALSIRVQGLRKPLDLVLRKNGVKRVISGHRRYMAMKLLRDDFLRTYESQGHSLKDIPFKTVPCRVLRTMTDDEEVVAMLDHGHAKGLRPSELFKAVKKLVEMRWGETAICQKLGFPRGKVATHFTACKQPEEVQKEYAKFLTDKKGIGVLPLSKPLIDKLKAAQKKDLENGTVGDTDSEYDKVWYDIKAGKIQPPGTRNKSLENIMNEQVVKAKSHPILLRYLKGLMSNKPEDVKASNDAFENVLTALTQVFPVVTVNTISEGITDSKVVSV